VLIAMSRTSRLALLLAALLAAAPGLAPAQPAPPADADAQPDAAEFALDPDDPPVRVGRLARLAGPAAELRLRGEEEFRPGRVNEPLIGGQAVTTPPGGRAELDFGATRLFLDGDTAVELADVPEAGLHAVLGRGAVLVRLAGAAATGETAEIVFSDGTVALRGDGRVLVEAGTPGRSGRVAVFDGEVEITTLRGPIRLRRGEAMVFIDGGESRPEPAGTGSALVAWAAGGLPLRAPPVAARGMTGAADLGRYGAWQTNAEYGDVWYPQGVGSSWVPFSDGAWEWRDPWGWTWIDAAPWAFATAHYGRWLRIGPRWGWAPAPVRYGFERPFRPVWAPATVAFFGAPPRPGFGRPVGWVPLGPREPYYPWFRASPGFVQRANLRTVVNVREVRNVWVQRAPRNDRDDPRRDPLPRGLDGFANRRAATVVPEDTLLRSRSVSAVGRRPRADQVAQAEASVGLPLRPDAATRGVTRREAARLALEPGVTPGRDVQPPTARGSRPANEAARDARTGGAEARRAEREAARMDPATPPRDDNRNAVGAAAPDRPSRPDAAARGDRQSSPASERRAAARPEPMRAEPTGKRPAPLADRERPRTDGASSERQRQIQAERAASQQQRATEREQRRSEAPRPEPNAARRPDREAAPERQERAAQRQQERAAQRQQERGERR